MTQWKDIDMELSKGNDGDIKAMKDVDAIGNSIKNIMKTVQGSRRMKPDFALPIHGLLFEPMDEATARRLGELMLQAIERWEDRVIVENLHVHANYDYNQYEVTLQFRLRNIDYQGTITDVISLA